MDTVMETVNTKTEEVIDKAVDNLDAETLRYLGAFGLGFAAGIVAYRKVIIPGWAKVLDIGRRSKKSKAKTEPVEAMDDNDNDNDEE